MTENKKSSGLAIGLTHQLSEDQKGTLKFKKKRKKEPDHSQYIQQKSRSRSSLQHPSQTIVADLAF